MSDHSRRDFIKWVLYLGAVQAIPAISSVADIPHDVLEGVSCVDKAIADLSGNPVFFRAQDDAAFEQCMQDYWKQENGSARYVRVFQDLGIRPAYRWQDQETDEWYEVPESYTTFFQYRRA